MNKKKKKMIDYGRYGYFFIAPFFITYLVFQLWPLINTFYYSTLSYYKRNGREFMEFAGLQKDVVLTGNLNRIEVWSKEKWNENNSLDDVAMDEIAEQMTDLGFGI